MTRPVESSAEAARRVCERRRHFRPAKGRSTCQDQKCVRIAPSTVARRDKRRVDGPVHRLAPACMASYATNPAQAIPGVAVRLGYFSSNGLLLSIHGVAAQSHTSEGWAQK